MKHLILAALATSLVGAASAQISVAKGQWQTEQVITATLIMDGERTTMPPETETSTECWSTSAQTELSPEALGLDNCDITNVKYTGDRRMSFDVDCDFDGLPMTGDLDVLIAPDKNSFDGTINLYATMDQIKFEGLGKLSGKRVGQCG